MTLDDCCYHYYCVIAKTGSGNCQAWQMSKRWQKTILLAAHWVNAKAKAYNIPFYGLWRLCMDGMRCVQETAATGTGAMRQAFQSGHALYLMACCLGVVGWRACALANSANAAFERKTGTKKAHYYGAEYEHPARML